MSANNNPGHNIRRYEYRLTLERAYAPNYTIEYRDLDCVPALWIFVRFEKTQEAAEKYINARLHLDAYPEEEEPAVKLINTYSPLR